MSRTFFPLQYRSRTLYAILQDKLPSYRIVCLSTCDKVPLSGYQCPIISTIYHHSVITFHLNETKAHHLARNSWPMGLPPTAIYKSNEIILHSCPMSHEIVRSFTVKSRGLGTPATVISLYLRLELKTMSYNSAGGKKPHSKDMGFCPKVPA